jgi:hypothetical protein
MRALEADGVRFRVARSASSERKECTGRPSSVRSVAALRLAAAERRAWATGTCAERRVQHRQHARAAARAMPSGTVVAYPVPDEHCSLP